MRFVDIVYRDTIAVVTHTGYEITRADCHWTMRDALIASYAEHYAPRHLPEPHILDGTPTTHDEGTPMRFLNVAFYTDDTLPYGAIEYTLGQTKRGVARRLGWRQLSVELEIALNGSTLSLCQCGHDIAEHTGAVSHKQSYTTHDGCRVAGCACLRYIELR